MKKNLKIKAFASVFAALMAVVSVVGCSSKTTKVDEAAVTPSTTVAQNSAAASNLGAGSSGRAH